MKILGISGWSGSGKTTLIVKLIPELISRGYSVSTLKHAHHKFDIDKPGKDSFRHREAGAKEVLVSSTARWALLHENAQSSEATFDQLCQKVSPVDILLVEGFKTEVFPKIEVWRGHQQAEPLYRDDPTVIAIATQLPTLDTDLPLLAIDDISSIADFIQHKLLQKSVKAAIPTDLNDCYRAPDHMISVAKARDLMLSQTAIRVATQSLSLTDAKDRILASDVFSSISLPPADNSAVDGYAFNFAQYAQNPLIPLNVIGRSAAGEPYDGHVQNGECVKIFTGAVLPDECDTIAMLEDCHLDGELIQLPEGLHAGRNRRKSGEDIKVDDLAISKGTRLHPPFIARLASIGIDQVSVYKKLKVGLISTGNELRDPYQECGPGQIFDANRYMLKSCFEKAGCDVTDYGISPDRLEDIQSVLATAAKDNHLVISSGGVSMGDEDHVKSAVESQGSLSFWRIAIKPGRPLAIGNLGTTPFIGLPGNPVAALVCTLQFAIPLALQTAGQTEIRKTPYFWVKSAFNMKKKAGRKEWLRGQYSVDDNGDATVTKFYSEGSGLITSLTWANGLIELDENITHIKEGDLLKFTPYSEFYQ